MQRHCMSARSYFLSDLRTVIKNVIFGKEIFHAEISFYELIVSGFITVKKFFSTVLVKSNELYKAPLKTEVSYTLK